MVLASNLFKLSDPPLASQGMIEVEWSCLLEGARYGDQMPSTQRMHRQFMVIPRVRMALLVAALSDLPLHISPARCQYLPHPDCLHTARPFSAARTTPRSALRPPNTAHLRFLSCQSDSPIVTQFQSFLASTAPVNPFFSIHINSALPVYLETPTNSSTLHSSFTQNSPCSSPQLPLSSSPSLSWRRPLRRPPQAMTSALLSHTAYRNIHSPDRRPTTSSASTSSPNTLLTQFMTIQSTPARIVRLMAPTLAAITSATSLA